MPLFQSKTLNQPTKNYIYALPIEQQNKHLEVKLAWSSWGWALSHSILWENYIRQQAYRYASSSFKVYFLRKIENFFAYNEYTGSSFQLLYYIIYIPTISLQFVKTKFDFFIALSERITTLLNTLVAILSFGEYIDLFWKIFDPSQFYFHLGFYLFKRLLGTFTMTSFEPCWFECMNVIRFWTVWYKTTGSSKLTGLSEFNL